MRPLTDAGRRLLAQLAEGERPTMAVDTRPLGRLEEDGLVTQRVEWLPPRPGMSTHPRPRQYVAITAAGRAALDTR